METMEENNVLTPGTPEMEKKPGNGKRVLKICLAVLMLAAAVFFAVLGFSKLSSDDGKTEEAEFFDATTFSSEQQYLEFNMLTDPVATFTLGENHGVYLAFYADDTGIYPYLVCLSQQDFEKYQDIYDFTFDERDISEGPGFATVYGYSEEISDELRDFAIEYFNYFTDTDLLNESNFYDYLGRYYLDTTAAPKKDTGDATGMFIAAAVLLVIAILLLLPKRQNKAAAPVPVQSDTAAPAGNTNSTAAPAWEIQPNANPALGILGAFLGSLAGAVVWIVLYRLGYIVGIAGYLAVVCSIWGYKKLGGGRISRLGVVLCVIISMAVLVLSNGVAYAWVVADTINESNPGRSSIGYILSNFGSIMESLDLWRSFLGDLAIGLVLALVAGISPLAAAFKEHKKQSEAV